MSDLSIPAAAAVPRRVKRRLALVVFGVALGLAFLCGVGFGPRTPQAVRIVASIFHPDVEFPEPR